MTDHLHPQRETYPLVNTDDELVMVFRGHIAPNLRPTLYLKALAATELRLDASRTLDDRAGFEVLDYTAGGTDTISITVNGGAPTVLTEATDFDAVVSNAETAIQIADAINTAALGLIATTEVGEPFVYVVPDPKADPQVKEFTLDTGDPAAWTHQILATPGSLQTLSKGEVLSLTIGSDPLKVVSFLKLFTGRVSADLRSPVECRSYFRQPATLSGNTGHPGGWPTSP